jgi:hypothetical protein
VLAFTKPKSVLGMMPKLWAMYFQNIEVTTEATGDHLGICRVKGLPFWSIAPVACGWLEFAYEKVGGSAKVREQKWSSGEHLSLDMVFDITWSESPA